MLGSMIVYNFYLIIYNYPINLFSKWYYKLLQVFHYYYISIFIQTLFPCSFVFLCLFVCFSLSVCLLACLFVCLLACLFNCVFDCLLICLCELWLLQSSNQPLASDSLTQGHTSEPPYMPPEEPLPPPTWGNHDFKSKTPFLLAFFLKFQKIQLWWA